MRMLQGMTEGRLNIEGMPNRFVLQLWKKRQEGREKCKQLSHEIVEGSKDARRNYIKER